MQSQRGKDHASFLPAGKLRDPDQVTRPVESELAEALPGLVVREIELGAEVRYRSHVEWQQLFKMLVKAANLELTAAATGRRWRQRERASKRRLYRQLWMVYRADIIEVKWPLWMRAMSAAGRFGRSAVG